MQSRIELIFSESDYLTTIIAADIFDRKLKWAGTFGATHTINAEKENLVNKVMEITGNTGVDYAFEVISSPETETPPALAALPGP